MMADVGVEKELEGQTELSSLTNAQLCKIIVSRGGTAREDAWRELLRRQPAKQELIFLCQNFIAKRGRRQSDYVTFIDRRIVPVLIQRNDLTYLELKELISFHSLDRTSKEQLGTMFFETPEVSQLLTEEDLFDLILHNRDAREKAWQLLTERFLSKGILLRLLTSLLMRTVDDRKFLASEIWPVLKENYELSIEDFSYILDHGRLSRTTRLEIIQMRTREITQTIALERSEKKPSGKPRGKPRGRPRGQRDDSGSPIFTPDDEPPVGDLYPPGYGPEE